MYTTTQHVIPLQTIFGAGYVPELHRDDAGRNLPRSDESDVAEFIERLKALCWGSDKAN
jgi:hypothetical protein